MSGERRLFQASSVCWFILTAAGVLLFALAPAYGQEGERHRSSELANPYDTSPSDDQRLYQQENRYSTRRYLDWQFQQELKRRYQYGYVPHRYGKEHSWRYPRYGCDPYHVLRYREDPFRRHEQEARNDRLLEAYLESMSQGLAAFYAGDYSTSARLFMHAASINQGDAASRIHTTHALTALGRYDEAVKFLRRAVQLQPQFVMLPLDIRKDYGRSDDFEQHYARLLSAAKGSSAGSNTQVLLGYYQLFTNKAVEAAKTLRAAGKHRPGDELVGRLIGAAVVPVFPTDQGAHR